MFNNKRQRDQRPFSYLRNYIQLLIGLKATATLLTQTCDFDHRRLHFTD